MYLSSEWQRWQAHLGLLGMKAAPIFIEDVLMPQCFSWAISSEPQSPLQILGNNCHHSCCPDASSITGNLIPGKVPLLSVSPHSPRLSGPVLQPLVAKIGRLTLYPPGTHSRALQGFLAARWVEMMVPGHWGCGPT